MKVNGLIVVLTISVMLVGCDHPKLRKIMLDLGMKKPESYDIQYQDEHLDYIFEEIYSHGVVDDFVVEEYDWIKFRTLKCDASSDKNACLNDENLQHSTKLQSILVEKLLSVSTKIDTVSPLQLPANIQTISMNRPDYYAPSAAYAPIASTLAYQGGDGKVYIADLKNGTYLGSLENRYRSESWRDNLQLSGNGQLLLTQYGKKFELFSTATGRFLASKEYSGTGYFTKSGRHILLKSKRSAVLLNTENLELAGSFLEFPAGHENMHFNPTTNVLVTWGGKTKDVAFYSLDEKELRFDRKSRVTIKEVDRRSINFIKHIVFPEDEKYAYVFVGRYLFKVNVNTGTYYLFLWLPYELISHEIIVQDDFMVTKAYMSNRKSPLGLWDHYVDIIDLAQGKFSSVELPGLRGVVLMATSVENTFLLAKGLGVQSFEIERDQLVFRRSEEVFPPPDKTKKIKEISKKIKKNKADFDKNVKYVGSGQDGIDQALHLGLIRLATESDLASWKSKNRNNQRILSRMKHTKKYVVLRPVRFGGGLSGATSAVFISRNSKVGPYGSIGHSTVLYSDTGACKGVLCKM